MSKKSSNKAGRLFRTVKEQAKQEGTIQALEQMEDLRNNKWLTMIFTVSAARVAAQESYNTFIDPDRLSANLPNKCHNTVNQIIREMKRLDKLIKDVIDTMDKEVLINNDRIQNLLDEFDNDDIYENFENNTKIKLEFMENLIRNFSPGKIQNIMEVLNEEYKKNTNIILRNDMQVFFVKTDSISDYTAMNIIHLEAFCKSYEVKEILTLNHDTGRSMKVNRKHLLDIYKGVKGYDVEFVNQYLSNIK